MRRLATLALLVLALQGCGLQDPYTVSSTSRSHAAQKKPPRAPSPAAPAADAGGNGDPLASARIFMRGYLPYLYGLGPARAIGAVTPALRRALAAQAMTREDGASPSHPRIEALRTISRSGRAARARAIVSDESRVYFALELRLVRGAGGWRVAVLTTSGG